MEDLEHIKDRIRKLLALSKSHNENEAAAAVRKADELMSRYRLGSADLVQYTAQKIKGTKRYSSWRTVLANAVECLYATYHVANRFYGTLTFYGEETDVFMATEVYEYLVGAVDRLARENIRRNAGYRYRQSYRYGVADRIYDRMREMGAACSWRSPDRLQEQKKAVSEYVQKQMEIQSKTRKGIPLDRKAFARGLAAGDGVSLSRQVPGRSRFLIPDRHEA